MSEQMNIDSDNNFELYSNYSLYFKYKCNNSNIDIPILNISNANSEEEKHTFDHLFFLLNNKLKESTDNTDNESPLRFLEIYFRKNNGNIIIYYYNPLQDIEGMLYNKTPLTKQEMTIVGSYNMPAINLIEDFILYTIHNSNLSSYLNEILDNQECVKITLDFYKGRPVNNLVFHKDTTGNTFYVTLSYNNPVDEIYGPEVIQFTNCEKSRKFDQERIVFRPIIPTYGTIGFNDEILAHSTPTTQQIEPGSMIMVYCDYIEGDKSCCIKPSVKRGEMPFQLKRPDFLRCWFQKFPDLPKNIPFIIKNVGQTIPFNLTKNINFINVSQNYLVKESMNAFLLEDVLNKLCSVAYNRGGKKVKHNKKNKTHKKSKKVRKHKKLKQTKSKKVRKYRK